MNKWRLELKSVQRSVFVSVLSNYGSSPRKSSTYCLCDETSWVSYQYWKGQIQAGYNLNAKANAKQENANIRMLGLEK